MSRYVFETLDGTFWNHTLDFDKYGAYQCMFLERFSHKVDLDRNKNTVGDCVQKLRVDVTVYKTIVLLV